MTPLRFLLFILTLFVMVAGAGAAWAETGVVLADKGANTCLKCHDQVPVTHILHTPHATLGDMRTSLGQGVCESCHGDSAAHLAKPAAGQKRASPAVVFSGKNASPVNLRNQACLSCHQGEQVMHWAGSKHATADLACTSCHTAHALKDPVLVKETQAAVCFTCHTQERAQSFLPSHHAMREGKVVCSDCHNAHGSDGPALLIKATVNETCYSCHQELRGPFLWEHAPVRESCSNCHVPHGSPRPNLLTERVPFLCQNCHDTSNHPSAPYNGVNLVQGSAPARQILMRGCLNCHSEVHGSNHPSGVKMLR